jgi:hypothetical protein
MQILHIFTTIGCTHYNFLKKLGGRAVYTTHRSYCGFFYLDTLFVQIYTPSEDRFQIFICQGVDKTQPG